MGGRPYRRVNKNRKDNRNEKVVFGTVFAHVGKGDGVCRQPAAVGGKPGAGAEKQRTAGVYQGYGSRFAKIPKRKNGRLKIKDVGASIARPKCRALADDR